VFVDPPGTGYSKIMSDSEDLRKRLFSVQGDADALAVVLRKWLTTHRRLASPKYLVGESYGSFRAVKLVRALRERESVGVTGLILISPVLDFSWLDVRNLLSYSAYLPSFAAVTRGARDRATLADVEEYAGGAYLTDLLKGVRDADALSRLSAKVAQFTGLNGKTASQLGGRVHVKTFSRERARDKQRVLSAYDGEVVGFDPAPFSQDSDWADPVLEALRGRWEPR
jgi:carboxypeptidase C (cathepsin A)